MPFIPKGFLPVQVEEETWGRTGWPRFTMKTGVKMEVS